MRPPTARRLPIVLSLVAAMAVTVACSSSPVTAVDSAAATATVVEVGDGLTYLVADEVAIRIQQPGAAELDELTAAGLALGPELREVSITGEATGSRFLVVPASGPDARLHVVLGDTVHPLHVRAGDRGVVTELADGAPTLLSQLEAAS